MQDDWLLWATTIMNSIYDIYSIMLAVIPLLTPSRFWQWDLWRLGPVSYREPNPYPPPIVGLLHLSNDRFTLQPLSPERLFCLSVHINETTYEKNRWQWGILTSSRHGAANLRPWNSHESWMDRDDERLLPRRYYSRLSYLTVGQIHV